MDDSFYERDLIVVCNDGYASSLAARSLQALGLAGATDLDGGYRAWRAQGFPTIPARRASGTTPAGAATGPPSA